MKTEISASKSIFLFISCIFMVHGTNSKNDIPMHLGQVLKWQNILVSNIFYHFLFAVSLGNWASKMSEKFGLDHKSGFQNMFYTKCINIIIDSTGPSIILRSVLLLVKNFRHVASLVTEISHKDQNFMIIPRISKRFPSVYIRRLKNVFVLKPTGLIWK